MTERLPLPMWETLSADEKSLTYILSQLQDQWGDKIRGEVLQIELVAQGIPLKGAFIALLSLKEKKVITFESSGGEFQGLGWFTLLATFKATADQKIIFQPSNN